MARMLRTMVSRLAGGKKNSAASSSRSRCSNRSDQFAARLAGTAMVGRVRDGGRGIGGFQPFIAQQQHRLAQIEGGEFRGGNGDHRVAQAHFVIVQAGALAAEQDGGARRPLGRLRAAAAPRLRACGFRFTTSRSRAVVASTRLKGASASAAWDRSGRCPECRRRPRPASGPGRWAIRIWGRSGRSSDRPKFFIARAAAPTFSPIWGWDRMTAGGVIGRFDGPVLAG